MWANHIEHTYCLASNKEIQVKRDCLTAKITDGHPQVFYQFHVIYLCDKDTVAPKASSSIGYMSTSICILIQ